LGLRPAPARARAADLLAAFELEAAADRQVKTYSGGMRRRLDIAASLIARPELLFLDEPTTGLDPAARNQVWDIVRALSATGATVLLTTQYLAEAEALATRVAVIDHGRLLAEGTPGELRAAGGTGTLHIRLADPDTRGRAAELLPDAVADGADPTALTVTATTSAQAAESLTRLTRDGVPVAGFSLDQPSLEEVFLALTAAPAPNGAPATSQKGS
ncbi:MAG: ATP-binding cassette domain-containing protein, partial [Catenulispora sp.]|nr:ATP-binding cassette domain-containing protein [Catenulispora sp.]